jgi:hypothetical protein
MSIDALSSSLGAIQRQSDAASRAAEKIERATLDTSRPESASVEQRGDSVETLASGSVELMVARRMFSAAIKMAQTANEGIFEALRIGGYGETSA